MIFFSSHRGQSLLEVIVALAIFSLIAAAMITLATGGFESLNQGGEQTIAENLATEGMEAVGAIRDRAWNELVFTTSSVSTSTGAWGFVGENTTQNIGKFLRTISFSNVCRDSNNNIATCPADYTDLYSKLVNVTVDWSPRANVTNTVRQVGYLTNWDSKKFIQTDWSGGSEQGIWSNTDKYDSDNGAIDTTSTSGQISLTSGNVYNTSGFLISSAYNMSDASPVQILEWDENNSGCSTCSVKLQLRVAPDSGGSPGVWSDWYGATGIGSYYTDHSGTLLSTVLNWKQWIEYRAELTGDGTGTPILQEVRIDYK